MDESSGEPAIRASYSEEVEVDAVKPLQSPRQEELVKFSDYPLNFTDVVKVLLEEMEAASEKVCSRVPNVCEGGGGSFVILRGTVEPKDLPQDDYGRWKCDNSHSRYFDWAGARILDKGGRRPPNYTTQITQVAFRNMSAPEFHKWTYRRFDNEGHPAGPFMMVVYEWKCEPYGFSPFPSAQKRALRVPRQIRPELLGSDGSINHSNSSSPSPRTFGRNQIPVDRLELFNRLAEIFVREEQMEVLRVVVTESVGLRNQVRQLSSDTNLFVLLDGFSIAKEVRKRSDSTLDCEDPCETFWFLKGLCEHTLAVAECTGTLPGFLEALQARVAADRDLSPEVKKVRRSAGKPSPLEHELLMSERCVGGHTELWHNNNWFLVDLLPGLASPSSKCVSCGLLFPAPGFGCLPPVDMMLVHMERCSWEEERERGALVHVKYSCVLRRYPYFWGGLVRLAESAKERLLPVHKRLLWTELAVQLQ